MPIWQKDFLAVSFFDGVSNFSIMRDYDFEIDEFHDEETETESYDYDYDPVD